MKKVLYLVLFCFLLTACGKKESNNNSSSSFDSVYTSSEATENSTFISFVSSNTSITSNTSNTSEDSSFITTTSEKETSEIISSITQSSEISTTNEKYYTATFLNYDGTILYVDSNVKEGTIPEYKGDTPVKEGTSKINYIFDGWDIYLGEIYENTTYVATFIEEEIYYTISDLLTFEGDYPIHYGKEVFLDDVGIVCVYSDNTFCVTSIHNPLDNFSIEVKANSPINGIYTSRDVVSISGTLNMVNGRPFIDNAFVSWGYNGDQYSADNSAYIGTVKMNNREYWEEKITKKESGNLYYSHMTIANIPEVASGKDISFYLVFPGEDIEITNNNPFLIEARIPSLTIEEADYVSTWFNKFNKGDGIYINLQIYYDSQKMILLPYDILKSNTYNIPYVHKNVYSSYDPVNDFLLKAYSKDYIEFPDMSNEFTYNYVTNSAFETINNSSMKYSQISFFTYQQDELINYLIELYSTNEEFIYIGLKDDGKYWVNHPYSPNLDMYICFYKGFGKIIFETHFLI